jgi:hypothetical protein
MAVGATASTQKVMAMIAGIIDRDSDDQINSEIVSAAKRTEIGQSHSAITW